MTTVAPGGTIGIVGTGQLGRMLGVAAAKLGLRVMTYGPENDPPAARIADRHFAAPYEDVEGLKAFAEAVDAVTYEFENIPPETVRVLRAHGVPVRPDDRVLAVCQDRLSEKTFLNEQGLATAPFRRVDSAADAEAAFAELGAGILKSRRLGYDGKGQARVSSAADAAAAFDEIGGVPAILEGLVAFEAEVSQIAARGQDGHIAFFDTPKNHHEGGILRTSTVPCGLPAAVAEEARALTENLMAALDYVGVMTVEFFWSEQTGLVANEIAPRVHNSGHWTVEACLASQFEQHIRAVAGWPLLTAARHSDAVMTNLIGDDASDPLAFAAQEDVALTLYGKATCREGRKMGHLVKISAKTQ